MNSVPLGDICRPKQWKTLPRKALKEDGYPVYGANGRLGFYDDFTHSARTILVGCRGSCGSIHLTEPNSYANGNAMALGELDTERVDQQYLFRFLRYRGFEDVITGTSQPQIIGANIRRVPVPLPQLPEQRRIAAILDKADALRHSRREAIAKLDQLLQSVFLEMFGDPVTNSKRWPVARLADYGQVITGNTPSRAVEDNYGSAIEWIKSDNLNTPSDYVTRADEYLSDRGAESARIVGAGSVLVTCIAGSFDCIGNLAISDRSVAFNQQINAVVPNTNTPSAFVYSLLKLSKRLIQAASTNSMKGMVSKSKFSAVTVPMPPADLQMEFAKCFEKYQIVRRSMEIAADKSSRVLASLQQRAFTGQL